MILAGLSLVWEQRLLFFVILSLTYTWVGYPVFVWLIQRVYRRPIVPSFVAGEPFVSVVVAVHNEEECIAEKLKDCLSLDYPFDRLEIIIVSDSSTDRTEEIVEEFAASDSRIHLLRSNGVGKSDAQNLATQHAKGEILLMTDAGTRTGRDLLLTVVANFADPRVGLVTGTVRFGRPDGPVLRGQGFYWRYEFFLRQAESTIGTLATGTGTVLAIRRSLFRPIPSCYGDDCVVPLDVRIQGYWVVQDPKVVVYDTMPHTMMGELRARVRMTARNWAGTLSRPTLLNPMRFPLTAWGLISHKFLRWLTPFLLIIAFALNTVLVAREKQIGLWVLQVLFYGAALVGWARARKERPAGVFAYPFSFCLANFGFFLGIMKVIRNQKIVSY